MPRVSASLSFTPAASPPTEEPLEGKAKLSLNGADADRASLGQALAEAAAPSARYREAAERRVRRLFPR